MKEERVSVFSGKKTSSVRKETGAVSATKPKIVDMRVSGRRKDHLGKINVKVFHQRSPYAMKFEDRSHEELAAFYFPAEEWVLPAESTKEPEERQFVVDSGASVHMVSKKDLQSAELETMRTSKNPTTVMTANGEVQTKEEATVYVKQLDLFVTVMLLEKHQQFFHSGNSVGIMGIPTTGSAFRNYISSEMAREFIAIYRTMCHLWFLVYQRVLLQLHLHLLLHHLHHRIQYLMSTNTQKSSPRNKWKYEWRASERPAACNHRNRKQK